MGVLKVGAQGAYQPTYGQAEWNGLEFPVNGIFSNKLLKPIAVANPVVHICIKEKGSC